MSEDRGDHFGVGHERDDAAATGTSAKRGHAAFHVASTFTWWFGSGIGLVHGAFVLAVAMPAMPGIHPRMASELRGPTVVEQLEPPGFMARNYGLRTPISVIASHVVYGGLLGALYVPAG